MGVPKKQSSLLSPMFREVFACSSKKLTAQERPPTKEKVLNQYLQPSCQIVVKKDVNSC